MFFTKDDYEKYKSDIVKRNEVGQIILPPDEYAMVMSEFNTHMSVKDREQQLVTKPIGSYYYTIINNGFDNYIVIGKRPIVSAVEELWED